MYSKETAMKKVLDVKDFSMGIPMRCSENQPFFIQTNIWLQVGLTDRLKNNVIAKSIHDVVFKKLFFQKPTTSTRARNNDNARLRLIANSFPPFLLFLSIHYQTALDGGRPSFLPKVQCKERDVPLS